MELGEGLNPRHTKDSMLQNITYGLGVGPIVCKLST
jgi:hypothetical protein